MQLLLERVLDGEVFSSVAGNELNPLGQCFSPGGAAKWLIFRFSYSCISKDSLLSLIKVGESVTEIIQFVSVCAAIISWPTLLKSFVRANPSAQPSVLHLLGFKTQTVGHTGKNCFYCEVGFCWKNYICYTSVTEHSCRMFVFSILNKIGN